MKDSVYIVSMFIYSQQFETMWLISIILEEKAKVEDQIFVIRLWKLRESNFVAK